MLLCDFYLSSLSGWIGLFSTPSQTSQMQHLNLSINHISHIFPSLGCVFSNSRLCFSVLRRAGKATAVVSPRKSLLCLFFKLDVKTTARAVPWGHRSWCFIAAPSQPRKGTTKTTVSLHPLSKQLHLQVFRQISRSLFAWALILQRHRCN